MNKINHQIVCILLVYRYITFNVCYQCGDWRQINCMLSVISVSLSLRKSYTGLLFKY